ncbi:MAG TPA: acyloxyacyl hydrolase [Candidatus Binatia bacterium]|nr:acyloxyacyl hydrolase [Candidatus Binatia bacterium]
MNRSFSIARRERRFNQMQTLRVQTSLMSVFTAAIAIGLFVATLPFSALAQTTDEVLSDPLRRPGWNYGGAITGGFAVVQVTSSNFLTANRNISNLALSFRVARVLSHERGPSLLRGSFEWDCNIIPVEIFWVLGAHYAGGFEPVAFRWNLTGNRHRVVPFAGVAGGLLFSPENFPPGNTYQMNFTAAIEAGTHVFVRRRRSIEVSGRVFHLSNAYLGAFNPGIPVGLQFTLGYSWY